MANKLSKVSSIGKGEYLSRTSYYLVKGKESHAVNVENESGFAFTIGNEIIEAETYTATQFDETVEVTRTELIAIFNGVGDTIFSVQFNKKPEMADINEAIESANKGRILKIDELKKLIKTAYKGKDRVLTGYMVSVENGFGRSTVIDLEADRTKSTPDWDSRIRQVDHRTLNWLIWKNKKYVVKK
jgi:hypothetical protein